MILYKVNLFFQAICYRHSWFYLYKNHFGNCDTFFGMALSPNKSIPPPFCSVTNRWLDFCLYDMISRAARASEITLEFWREKSLWWTIFLSFIWKNIFYCYYRPEVFTLLSFYGIKYVFLIFKNKNKRTSHKTLQTCQMPLLLTCFSHIFFGHFLDFCAVLISSAPWV